MSSLSGRAFVRNQLCCCVKSRNSTFPQNSIMFPARFLGFEKNGFPRVRPILPAAAWTFVAILSTIFSAQQGTENDIATVPVSTVSRSHGEKLVKRENVYCSVLRTRVLTTFESSHKWAPMPARSRHRLAMPEVPCSLQYQPVFYL